MREAPRPPLRIAVFLFLLAFTALTAGEQEEFPHLSTAVRNSEPGIVLVRTLSPDARGRRHVVARNTGFFVDDDGTVVTSLHVWARESRLEVLRRGGERAEARISAFDQHAGLALLDTDFQDTPGLKPAATTPGKDQWMLLALARSRRRDGFHVLYRPGRVSAVGSKRRICGVGWKDLVTVEVPVVKGAAAAPLLNRKGRIAAIIVAAERTSEGRSRALALPPARYKESLKIMREGGRRMGWLGLALTCRSDRTGARVEAVMAGSPADAAGLQRGDRLLQVDSTEVTCPASLEKGVVRAAPGTTVKLHIRRDDRTKTVEVELAPRPLRVMR